MRRSFPVALVVAAALAVSFLLLGEGSARGEGDDGAGSVYRHRSLEDAERLRERWEREDFEESWRRRGVVPRAG